MSRRVTMIDFSDIFKHAEEHFNIGWNKANDVFFGNALEYGTVCDVYPGDGKAYTILHEDDRDVLHIPKDEVIALSKHDQSYIIMDHFFATKRIRREVSIDCR